MRERNPSVLMMVSPILDDGCVGDVDLYLCCCIPGSGAFRDFRSLIGVDTTGRWQLLIDL